MDQQGQQKGAVALEGEGTDHWVTCNWEVRCIGLRVGLVVIHIIHRLINNGMAFRPLYFPAPLTNANLGVLQLLKSSYLGPYLTIKCLTVLSVQKET